MELSKFNDTLMYSNKNMEKLARNLINESCNAVLMEMFENKCVLADHTTGQIYEAKYSFDGKVFELNNFNKLTFENTNTSLKEAISDYFNDSDISLVESYEKAKNNDCELFENSLTNALASKRMDNIINYSELSGINEEVKDVKNTKAFKLFEERLNEHPTESIKVINWKDPVKVSLLDEDYQVIVNKTIKSKAKNLKSDSNFKKDLIEAASVALNGNEEVMEEFVRNNISLLALDKAGIKEAVGISVIGNKELVESRNKIVEMINNVIDENEDLLDKRNDILSEEDTEEEKPEASEEDTEAIKKALETAKSKAKDEKLIGKIDDLISSLSDAADAGETDVSAMKEAVELLKM